ncbi:MAG TPA: SpoIID/LytB domain-containing protein [Bacteroides sp.]|nr:SpoIID/LytB domain-containing protein [Bacteroides sp.]
MNRERKLIQTDRRTGVRVGILRAEKIRFHLHGKYRITGSEEPRKGSQPSRTGSEEIRTGRGEALIRNGTIDILPVSSRSAPPGSPGPVAAQSPVRVVFQPLDPDQAHFELCDVTIGIGFHWERQESQKFRGSLVLEIWDGRIQVINEIDVESYLASVISSEMNAGSPPEFLKAHAVISRSWLMAQIRKRGATAGSPKAPSGRSRLPYGSPDLRAGAAENGMRETDEEVIRWYDREDHEAFDVCADDHCQRYQGITRAHHAGVVAAVGATAGEVLYYGNDICDARFSKCCGGVTERFGSCWEDAEHPYLQPVADRPDPVSGAFPDIQAYPDLRIERNARAYIRSRPEAFCNTSDRDLLGKVLNDFDLASKDFFRWKVTCSQEELSALIREKSGRDFGKILDLVPVERGASARLVRLRIVGTTRSIIVGKELEIRRWLSHSHLYSSAFMVEREDFEGEVPGKFILHGAGWGHGVGLCQIGAAVMADRGYTYRGILEHYYRNAVIRKRDESDGR